MIPIKVLIVEDEPIIAADLSLQLTNAGIEVMECLDDGEEVLSYLQNERPDIILLDIRLYGDLDGIDVANSVNALYKIPIIFLTSNTDLATFKRAKLSFPHAFLSKPFRIKDVLHSIELALSTNTKPTSNDLEFLPDRIFIRNKESLEKVFYNNILFLEADGSYSRIVTDTKEYLLSQTLKRTEENISADYIIRVHRSFVVNVRNIDRVAEGFLYIGPHKIPISRSYKEEVHSLFKTL